MASAKERLQQDSDAVLAYCNSVGGKDDNSKRSGVVVGLRSEKSSISKSRFLVQWCVSLSGCPKKPVKKTLL